MFGLALFIRCQITELPDSIKHVWFDQPANAYRAYGLQPNLSPIRPNPHPELPVTRQLTSKPRPFAPELLRIQPPAFSVAPAMVAMELIIS